jgi:hypothetical protein
MTYHAGSRELQDHFDTRRLADRLVEVKVRDTISADDRVFIEAVDMLFFKGCRARLEPASFAARCPHIDVRRWALARRSVRMGESRISVGNAADLARDGGIGGSAAS